MSQANVESVRRLLGVPDVERTFEWWHPEVEWVIAREHPEARTLNGPEEVVAYLREWQAAMPDMRFEADRLADAGTAVVAVGTIRGTGVGSGADVEVALALVYLVEDGLIVRVVEYLKPSEALSAAGLEE